MPELLKMCVFGAGSVVCVVGGLAIASVLLLASLNIFVHAIDILSFSLHFVCFL